MVLAGLLVWGGLGAARPYLQHVGAERGQGATVKEGKFGPSSRDEVQITKKLIDLIIEELPEDMKLLPWRSLQGIKDERLLVSVLSRVVENEFSLDEMVTEFQK